MQTYETYKAEFEARNNLDFNPFEHTHAVASEIVAYYSKEYVQLKNTIKELTKKANSLKTKLKDYMGEKEEMVDTSGTHLHYYKHEQRKSFDEETFKKEMPRLHAKYLTIKEIRRFL